MTAPTSFGFLEEIKRKIEKNPDVGIRSFSRHGYDLQKWVDVPWQRTWGTFHTSWRSGTFSVRSSSQKDFAQAVSNWITSRKSSDGKILMVDRSINRSWLLISHLSKHRNSELFYYGSGPPVPGRIKTQDVPSWWWPEELPYAGSLSRVTYKLLDNNVQVVTPSLYYLLHGGYDSNINIPPVRCCIGPLMAHLWQLI